MAPPPWIDDLDLLPAWMDPASREALGVPTENSPAALVAAGRLLRGGYLPGGARQHLEAGLRALDLSDSAQALTAHVEHLVKTLETRLEALDEAMTDVALWSFLGDRDDLESLSWSLGLTGLESVEKRLLRLCRTLDGRALARRDRLARVVSGRAPGPEWLFALAHHSPGAWWSNLLIASDHREQIAQWLTRPLVGSALSSLGLSPRVMDRVAALQFGGEAGSEPEAILARPLGAPVATLFDGRVVVHTHGLAEHDDEAPPGLVVRHAEGAFEAILEVGLDPEGPVLPHRSPLALAWWVPLAGATTCTLQVKVRDAEGDEVREESLAIEPLSAPSPVPPKDGR